MKKVILKLGLDGTKQSKQKAMNKASELLGIDSISMDSKDKKLTVTGDMDPVDLAIKLRKLCLTEMVSVGPAKEEPKKEGPKKKVILKLGLDDTEQSKQKAMTKAAKFLGVDSVSMDSKDKKLTVTGDMDPVDLAIKLRKLCLTEMVSVGPAKEEPKKKEHKKEVPKKDDKKKDFKEELKEKEKKKKK